MLSFTPTARRTNRPRLFFTCAKAAQHRSRCRRATVLRGAALANDSDIAREAQFVLLDRTGEVTLEANNDATVLILSNAPIDEPVHSSFIINTTDGIRQGMIDFQSGRFGAISALNHKPRECVLMRRRKNYKPQES